jgi:alpha-galactosidase
MLSPRRAVALLMITGTLLIGTSGIASAMPGKSPVKVFVLVGQSNMVGKGAMKHLAELVKKEPDKYGHLQQNGQWTARADVWVRYPHDKGEAKGYLKPGYGTPGRDHFGPELGFGHAMGEALDEQVLIIKCAWGGRSLYEAFRPPSAKLPAREVLIKQYKKAVKKAKKKNQAKPAPDEFTKRYGRNYRDTVRIVGQTLENLDKHFPAYDGRGFELAGLVWFQGFNDIIDRKAAAEYETNLVHLIRDFRDDFNAPDLPIVIGELGQQGTDIKPRYAKKHRRFRAAQKAPSQMEPFKDTVAFARTAPHVVKDGKKFNGGYHYRGRADTFYKIGLSFGEAMKELLDE